jgi:NADH-quinone oxidoreductase subunit L
VLEHAGDEKLAGGIKYIGASHNAELMCTAGAFVAFVTGAGLAYWMYVVEKGRPAKALAAALPRLHKILMNKWYVDEAYEVTVLASVDALADTSAAVDRGIVDMVIAKVTAVVVAAVGTLLRAVQTGAVHLYAGMMVVGLAAFGWFFITPHANVTQADKGDGNFELTAAQGLGYQYQWVEVGKDKTPPLDAYSQRVVPFTVHVDEGTTKVVELRTKNAFTLTTTTRVTIERPKAPEVVEVGQN